MILFMQPSLGRLLAARQSVIDASALLELLFHLATRVANAAHCPFDRRSLYSGLLRFVANFVFLTTRNPLSVLRSTTCRLGHGFLITSV